jgi:UTP--glucose-1-phosphate uridylyltransferase
VEPARPRGWLRESGMLGTFIVRGKKCVMISNIDNLGSCIDLKVLNKVVTENVLYACETTDKTSEEWKGKLTLLETAQVPPDHMDDYIKVRYLHANNFWVSLEAIRSARARYQRTEWLLRG